jgi:hypothetical protein
LSWGRECPGKGTKMDDEKLKKTYFSTARPVVRGPVRQHWFHVSVVRTSCWALVIKMTIVVYYDGFLLFLLLSDKARAK